MFELIFGLFFIILPLFVLKAFMSSGNYFFAFIVCGLFIVIGVFFVVKSLIKLIKDFNTSKKGEECFGAVNAVVNTGKSVNEHPIYKAEFIVYVGSEYRTFNIFEEVGMDPSKYPIGSYVKLKYYDNDVNVIGLIDESVVPEDIREKIKVDFKPIDEVIEVDGIKYKRMY